MEKIKCVVVVFTALIVFSTPMIWVDATANEDDLGPTTCAYTHTNDSVGIDSSSAFDVFSVDERRFVGHCKFCFSIWRDVDDDVDSENVIGDKKASENHRQIISQGCWLNSDGCSQARCVMTKDPHIDLGSNPDLDGLKFCCCSGDDCNSDISTNVSSYSAETDVRLAQEQPVPVTDLVSSDVNRVDYIFIGIATFFVTASVAFFCLAIVVWIRSRRHDGAKSRRQSDCESLCDNQNGENISKNIERKSLNLTALTIEGIIGQGKYGVVYKAQLDQGGFTGSSSSTTAVAVKVFSHSQKKSFFEEREVYELARFSIQPMTSSVLDYFGSAENAIVNNIVCDSLLVISFAEQGSLLSFLKSSTVSWTELCRMLQNITQGLTALHTGFQDSGNKISASICHRDINTRNILVRADLSCCISDFGSSIRLRGSTIFRNGTVFSAETGCLPDAGTIRYLSPELLEGCLNLFDCEASLKQADVYAVALVFWELSRRCRDLYQGARVNSFEQAYERELGCLCPAMEQMRNLVARNRARPLFPEIWKKCNPAIQQLQETIEDCWDHDGEARLTAPCVLERINQLPGLWDHYKITSQGPPSIESSIPNHVDMKTNSTASQNDAKLMSRNDAKTTSHCVETTNFVTSTNVKLDNEICVKNDNILSRQQPVRKIQPFQGRNLCLERNLISPTDLDSSESSPLIEKSTKDSAASSTATAKFRQNNFNADFEAENGVNETSPGPFPTAPRFQNSIAYVKNDFSQVSSSSSQQQQNVNEKNVNKLSPKNASFWRAKNAESQKSETDKNVESDVDKKV